MHKKTSKILILIALLPLVTASCRAIFRTPDRLSGSDRSQTGSDIQKAAANGERIYFTASNEEGDTLRYSGGPNFGGMMMGTYLTCAACHGPEARGGTHRMHMQVMDAPDIRYVTLQEEAEEHGLEAEHGEEHAEYTLQEFRLAVIDGKHPDGDSLDRDMPRWEMSGEDLSDLFEFLKTIP